MSHKNKKPAPLVTQKSGQKRDLSQSSHSPARNYITEAARGQRRIADYLSAGQANAIPLRQLESITGLDGRVIRVMIAAERRAGIPILSDNSSGYYLPENDAERAEFVRSMRHRAQEILKAADAVERCGGLAK